MFGDLNVSAHSDIGNLGPEASAQLTFHWPLTWHLIPLVPYALALLFFAERSNRARALRAVVPPAAVMLGLLLWLSQFVPDRAFNGGSADFAALPLVVLTVAVWWLTGEGLANKGVFRRVFRVLMTAAFICAASLAAHARFDFFGGAGSEYAYGATIQHYELKAMLITFSLLTGVLFAGIIAGRIACRKKGFTGKRFALGVLAGVLVAGIPCFLMRGETMYATWAFAAAAPLHKFSMQIVALQPGIVRELAIWSTRTIEAAITSLATYALIVPFLAAASWNEFFRNRLLRMLGFDGAPVRAPADWRDELRRPE